jgi:hypothetical protein
LQQFETKGMAACFLSMIAKEINTKKKENHFKTVCLFFPSMNTYRR